MECSAPRRVLLRVARVGARALGCGHKERYKNVLCVQRLSQGQLRRGGCGSSDLALPRSAVHGRTSVFAAGGPGHSRAFSKRNFCAFHIYILHKARAKPRACAPSPKLVPRSLTADDVAVRYEPKYAVHFDLERWISRL